MKSFSTLAFCIGLLLPAQHAIAEPAAGLFHPPMPGTGKFHPPMPDSVGAASSNGAHGLDRRAASMKCNGYNELCNRKYDKIAYVTTHNSFATGDNIAANQNREITQQLDEGVRALMLDIHDPNSTKFSRKRSEVVPTLCHSACMLLNKGPIVDQLKNVKTYLDENPFEVITVFVENANKFDDKSMAEPFEQAGLVDYAHVPTATYVQGYEWPTLGEMISKNKRLVVLASTITNTTEYPWLLYDRNYAVQTSYSVKVGENFDCKLISDDRSLHVMNHFVSMDYDVGLFSVEKPDYNSSAKVNTLDSLIDQANQCGKAGHFPNFVTVDFFDAGDVLLAVANINKVNFVNTTTSTFKEATLDGGSEGSSSSGSTHSAGVSIARGSSHALVAGILSVVAGTLALGF